MDLVELDRLEVLVVVDNETGAGAGTSESAVRHRTCPRAGLDALFLDPCRWPVTSLCSSRLEVVGWWASRYAELPLFAAVKVPGINVPAEQVNYQTCLHACS